jgi:DNA-directed RNA polymerase specialized sigma24 family protein
MSNSAEVAIAGEGNAPSPSLSEDQRAAFWAGILVHRDAARGMAARFVSRQSVEDVVDTAAVRFIESLQRPKKPKPFPADDVEFRRRFLKIVRNHAINCGHSEGSERSVHSHWGMAMEPAVGGRRAGDRELDHVFARNDHAKYDAPAPVERRPQDDVEALRGIFREHVDDLPPMQREVVSRTFFEGRKRAAVAAALGISVKTYDCHLQAAFRFLRVSLPQDALAYPELDRSVWYDIIEELCERCDAARVLRPSRKKGKRSRSEGDRSKSEGDPSKSEGAGGKNVGSAAA